jgi:hypothetical protein
LKKEVEQLKNECVKIEILKNKITQIEKDLTYNKSETKVRVDHVEDQIYRHKLALDDVVVMKADFFRALEVRDK